MPPCPHAHAATYEDVQAHLQSCLAAASLSQEQREAGGYAAGPAGGPAGGAGGTGVGQGGAAGETVGREGWTGGAAGSGRTGAGVTETTAEVAPSVAMSEDGVLRLHLYTEDTHKVQSELPCCCIPLPQLAGSCLVSTCI